MTSNNFFPNQPTVDPTIAGDNAYRYCSQFANLFYVEKDGCPKGWTWNPDNNFCYYISDSYASFNVSDKSCRRMSSTFASLTSSDEYYFMLPLLYVHRWEGLSPNVRSTITTLTK